MNEAKEHSNIESQGSEPQISQQPESSEKNLEYPKLELKVLGNCNTVEGPYISLNSVQRAELLPKTAEEGKAEEEKPKDLLGELVEVLSKDSEKRIGVFVVGLGKKGQVKESCYINSKQNHQEIVVRVLSPENRENLTITLPTSLIDEKTKKHATRSQIITQRFPELKAGMYIAVPTSVAILAGMPPSDSKPTVRKISSLEVKLGDQIHKIAIVPGGDTFDMTKDAAELLGIPPQIQQIDLRVEAGRIIID